MNRYDPEHIPEPFVEPDPSKKVIRYKRMCPKCLCVEGPRSTIILEDDGIVTCKNCNAVLAYFEIWDMDTQTKLAKSWCCKHPQQFRKGIGILDGRIVIPHDDPDSVVYSEASADTVPGGYKFVNKYICFKCLTVVTRKSEHMDRNDVTWSKPFLDSLATVGGRNMEGMNMPWFEDQETKNRNQSRHDKPVDNVDKVKSYPLTLDEYVALPYLVNIAKDLSQWGAHVIELNLIFHAGTQEELLDKIPQEIKQWIEDKMSTMDVVPLPAGYEVHDGKVRRTPGTMGAAIPAQYQRFNGGGE
jgi:hypothetical protein